LIGAGIAHQGIVAAVAVEVVVAGVAGNKVVEAVAGAADIGGAQQVEVLDIGAEPILRGRGKDRIGPLTGQLDDHVQYLVDVILVVAGSAPHRIHAGAAVDHVIGRIPGDVVVELVAPGVDRGTLQNEIFDIRVKRVVVGRNDRVGSLASVLVHRV